MDPEKLARAFRRLPDGAPSRSRVLGGFAVGVASALAAGTLLGALGRRRGARRTEEETVDRAVEATFPASDPPAFGEGDPRPMEAR